MFWLFLVFFLLGSALGAGRSQPARAQPRPARARAQPGAAEGGARRASGHGAPGGVSLELVWAADDGMAAGGGCSPDRRPRPPAWARSVVGVGALWGRRKERWKRNERTVFYVMSSSEGLIHGKRGEGRG